MKCEIASIRNTRPALLNKPWQPTASLCHLRSGQPLGKLPEQMRARPTVGISSTFHSSDLIHLLRSSLARYLQLITSEDLQGFIGVI
jgi:hypothetical protein